MITMQEVYRNSNEWLVRQNRIQNAELAYYKERTKTWWQKIAEYFREIV